MYGRSAVLDARRNAVAPAMLILPLPADPLSSRRLTSVLYFTNSRANCRLLTLPEPVGGGWPSGSSPRLGLRTHDRACNGANPERWSFELAPALSSSTAN